MAYNEYAPRQRIATFHQLWFVPKGRLYEKREVKVQERAYATDEIRRMLKKAGLRLLKSEIQRRTEGKPIRMLYLARKQTRIGKRNPTRVEKTFKPFKHGNSKLAEPP
jgi:uncharacterized protein YlaI